MTTNSQTALQAAMAQAGLVNHDELARAYASDDLCRLMGFVISANYGKIATRILNLARPARGTTAERMAELKTEVKTLVAQVAWGIDNIGDFMRDIDECLNEWAGGGFSKPKTDEELQEIAQFMGIPLEVAKATAEASRMNSQNYNAIRRQNMAPVMVAQINNMLHDPDCDSIEPDAETLIKYATKAFHNAVMFGRWPDAALIKADVKYHTGKELTMPTFDNSMAQKAEAIRDSLARKQADQAAQDLETLKSFDINQIADFELAA